MRTTQGPGVRESQLGSGTFPADRSYHWAAETGKAMQDADGNEDVVAGAALTIGFILFLAAVFGAYFLFVVNQGR
jgi:hypothetical protein